MITQEFAGFALLAGMILTLGGCYCCQVCQYCSDNMSTMTFDLSITDDECDGGCAAIDGTYVVDMDESCCAEYNGASQPCSTTACDSCGATATGDGSICCDPADVTFPSGYCAQYAAGILGDPACTGDASYDTCSTTPGCSPSTAPAPTDSGCVSDSLCDDMFGAGVAGYSCSRSVVCVNDCGCGSVAASVSACITESGGDIHLTGAVSDGYRSYTFDETLGAGSSVVCLTEISSLAVTLTENPNGGAQQLCTTPTLTITGGT